MHYWPRDGENRFFDNGSTNLHIKLSTTHVNMSTITYIMVADPHNTGLYILFCRLSAILAEIQ